MRPLAASPADWLAAMPEWDTSEVHALAARFRAAPPKAMAAIVPVANKAGVNMKRDMKRAASGHSHLPGLSRAVSYDVESSPAEVKVTVGFDKRGQGNLANIAAFGSVNNAPVMDIMVPLASEVPNFMRWAAKVVGESMK
jgi:hypothetical protein